MTELAIYAPPPAVARAHAARGYGSLVMEAHFAAMDRRARMNRVVEVAEAPRPTREKSWLSETDWKYQVIAANRAVTLGIGRASIIEIQKACADAFGTRRADIIGPRRTADVVLPRQVAYYLTKELTGKSLPELGRRFGGRDHTSILCGIRKVKQRLAVDADFAANIGSIAVSLVGDG